MESFDSEENSVPTTWRVTWRKSILAVSSIAIVACTTTIFITVSGSDDDPNVQNAGKIKVDRVPRYSGIQSIYRYNCDDESVNCTPLDEYVWRDNKDYKYKVVAQYDHPLALRPTRTIILNMTSQNWLTTEDVTRTEWWHEVIISIPYDYDPDLPRSASLVITGDQNRPDSILDEDDRTVAGCRLMAQSTRTISAVIKQIPNEKLYFLNDTRMGEQGRTEDEIIAWTWKHFLYYPDEPDWLLRLPMTKAARLAIDTIDAVFIENRLSMGLSHMRSPIDQIALYGSSKRGWTAWLLAAVDKRIKVLSLSVLDCLNMEKLFLEWYQNLGAWSFALSPYYDEGLTEYFESPQFHQMSAIIDPYYYRDRLTMPKMVISASSDEFFAPDDSYAWYNDMKGPTYLRILPNAEHNLVLHGLSSPSIITAFRGFYLAVMRKYPLPELEWTREVGANGYATITLTSSKLPTSINGWTADTKNSTRRDFRWVKMKNEAVDWPTNDRSTPLNGSNTQFDIRHKIVENEVGNSLSALAAQYDISEEDLEFQPIKWNRVIVQPVGDKQWQVSIPPSYSGFRALFMEVSFAGSDDKSMLTFTTEVMITPDSRPFPPCAGAECYSYML